MSMPDEGDGMPAFWLSDEPVGHELWSQLRVGRTRSGFWPLLLASDDDAGRPWATGEVRLDGLSSPADHDPEVLLRAWWHRNVHPEQIANPFFGPSQAIPDDLLAPLGKSWPSAPAAVPPHQADPDDRANALAQWVLDKFPTARLGMVAAGSGADALTAAGWQGPVNHTNDTGQISAVALRVLPRQHLARRSGDHALQLCRPTRRLRQLGLLVGLEHVGPRCC